MSTFPIARGRRRGYDTEQVEDFLRQARRAYDVPVGGAAPLTAEDIRTAGFSLRKGGYSTEHVDAALERLEDAFAARERDGSRQRMSEAQWFASARETAQEIVNRLSRPVGSRFRRTGILSVGYNRADVDRFAKRLSRYFQEGTAMSIEEVRTVAFRPQRGGYSEVQVDVLLDSVTDVMLSVR